MFVTPTRPTALRALRVLCLSAGASLTSLALLGTSTALASEASGRCEGQAFSQPFAQLGDFNYYTLAPGSQFNSGEEGWQLSGGARVVSASSPLGEGGALEMPGGSEAISPPMCVTLLYPTARMFVRRLEGDGNLRVSVSYANLKKPRRVAGLHGKMGQWTLSESFEVRPQLGGETEEAREVRFTLLSTGGNEPTYQVDGLYVDPRMV